MKEKDEEMKKQEETFQKAASEGEAACDYDYDYDEDEDVYDFAPKAETSRGAWSSLILGIIGSVSWLVPVIGIPITIVGIIFGAMNFKSKKAKGAAIGGFVTNIVFLLAAIAKGIVDIVRISRKSK